MNELPYLEKEGSRECLAVLKGESKTTPEIINSVDASENTIRARLAEGVDHGYIEQIPTTSVENKYRLVEGSIPDDGRGSTTELKEINVRTDTPDRLHRDQLNDYSENYDHINSPFGGSSVNDHTDS